jgi:hypothetical protein
VRKRVSLAAREREKKEDRKFKSPLTPPTQHAVLYVQTARVLRPQAAKKKTESSNRH